MDNITKEEVVVDEAMVAKWINHHTMEAVAAAVDAVDTTKDTTRATATSIKEDIAAVTGEEGIGAVGKEVCIFFLFFFSLSLSHTHTHLHTPAQIRRPILSWRRWWRGRSRGSGRLRPSQHPWGPFT